MPLPVPTESEPLVAKSLPGVSVPSLGPPTSPQVPSLPSQGPSVPSPEPPMLLELPVPVVVDQPLMVSEHLGLIILDEGDPHLFV